MSKIDNNVTEWRGVGGNKPAGGSRRGVDGRAEWRGDERLGDRSADSFLAARDLGAKPTRRRGSPSVSLKLADRARANEVYPKTAFRWSRAGTKPVAARQVNARVVLVDAPIPVDDPGMAALAKAGGSVGLNALVSSHDQWADLDPPGGAAERLCGADLTRR
jgi:hypothetical protein